MRTENATTNQKVWRKKVSLTTKNEMTDATQKPHASNCLFVCCKSLASETSKDLEVNQEIPDS